MAYNVYQDDELIEEGIEDKECTVEGLKPNTEYFFSVSEVIGDKESEKETITVTTKPIAVTGVTIAPKTATLEVGETQQLTSTVAPSNATDKSVTYASRAQGVADVYADGLITAKVAGEAEIVVTTTDGEKKDTCVVTVKEPVVDVTGVTLSPKTSSAEAGTADERQLTATVAPSGASNKAVTYAIAPTTTGLSVSNAGLISWTDAVAAGTYTTTVTTTDGAKTDTHVLTLTDPEPEPDPEEGD